MSDIERLKDKVAAGELLLPLSDVPSIVALARALGALAGVEGMTLDDSSARLVRLIGPADHLIFVLADGLGMALLEAGASGSVLARHVAAELRSVFPSASAVALTSVATGEWPGRHGVTGWWTYLPEIGAPGALLPFVNRTDGRSLSTLGLTAEHAFPVPPLMARMGRDVAAWFPAQISDSVSSAYFSGGGPRHAYRTLAQAVGQIIARIAGAGTPTYTYLYAPRIDAEAHQYGASRPEVMGALAELDGELSRLARYAGGRARIVVSADHGLLDTPVGAKHPFRFSGVLAESLLRPPSGDSRVSYFHVREGAEDQFQQAFRRRFRDRFLLLTIEEAATEGLFGPSPLAPGTRARLGTFLALSQGLDVLEYVWPGGTPRALNSIANHSGLTPAEMRVPLVLLP